MLRGAAYGDEPVGGEGPVMAIGAEDDGGVVDVYAPPALLSGVLAGEVVACDVVGKGPGCV